MSDWKKMAKRLRKNQENSVQDYDKQNSKAEARIKFCEQIADEQARVLSNARRNPDKYKTMNHSSKIELFR